MVHPRHIRNMFLTLACLFLATAAPSALAAKRPNIVVFIADDAGMDFGAYGNRSIKTPHIDALAAEGVRFTKAFLTSPQCSPSRTSMLSGRFAHTIGTEDLHVGIDAKTDILPRHLHEAGYFTGFMLKGHIGSEGEKQFDWTDHGFFPDWIEGKWNAKALGNFQEALDKAGEKPFFLWVAFVDPHRPYGDPANAAPRVNNPQKIRVPPFLVNSAITRRDLADYYDEISRMDTHIGNMLGELDRRGLRDDTIIVFLSDNGMPFPRAKGTLYDSGIQTPLVFNWRGKIKPGQVFDGLTSTIDLAPTLLDLVGAKVPEHWYGQTFAPALFGKGQGRSHVYSERNWHGVDEHARSVRTERHKLIINAYIELPHGTPSDLSTSPSWYELIRSRKRGGLRPAQQQIFLAPRPAVELYDLEADPHEVRNLADDPAHLATIEKLLKTLDAWMKETGDHSPDRRRRGDRVDRVTGAPLPKAWELPYNMD